MKNIFCITILIITALISVYAIDEYPMQRKLKYYDCIDYEANRLIYPGDSGKFETLYGKLDSLALFGTTKITIVNIGGSHIQADVFSNRMRMNFANSLPALGSERGAIFPFSAAKTNNPKNFEVRYSGSWNKTQNSRPPVTETLGITGYAISTDDKNASVTFNLNPEGYNSDWKYNRLRLLAKVSEENKMPLLIIEHDTITAKIEDGTYVFYLNKFAQNGKIILGNTSDYERLYQKYKSTIFEPDVTELSTKTDRTAAEDTSYSLNIGLESDNGLEEIKENAERNNHLFTITCILPENDFNGITYHSLGVNGASLKSWLRCEDFEKQMSFIKPDLAIMSVGINDANVPTSSFSKETYKARYTELIKKIYAVNPNCAVIFITNNDCVLRSGRYSQGINKNGEIVQQAIYELAKEHGAAVWDMFKIMGGLGSISVWSEKGLANKDRVHFLVPGYNILGDLMYNAIIYDWLYKTDRNQ